MKKLVGIVVVFVLVGAGAFFLGRFTAGPAGGSSQGAAQSPASGETKWICPMHPQIQMPQNEPCPICGMDLVEKSAEEIAAALAAGPRGISMSKEAKALLEVETAPVERRFVTRELRTAGQLALDETRVSTVAARFAGRLDRLFVDYVGMSVREGDHLAEVYSPALVTAQQELLEAKRALDSVQDEGGPLLAGRRATYRAARQKLSLWGIGEDQIESILQRGEAQERITLRAPASGVVLGKMQDEGDYVKEGAPLLRIADLSRLWVLLDVYEQDLPWLRYGQRAWIETDALPGKVFEGIVSFVAPVVHERRRTIRVRVNVENPKSALRPGMLVRGRLASRLAAGGRVMDARLAGKWISPMHPEVVKDAPGSCDVCGMPLVRAEELGFALGELGDKPLVVPASAVLTTGRRAVVYVFVPGKAKPTYEGREVRLGARAGDWYLVEEGLSENERVVVQGAFMIDSALQIDGKPSMMSLPGSGDDFTRLELREFRASLVPLFTRYFEMMRLLAADDVTGARGLVASFEELVTGVASQRLPTRARELWQDEREVLERSLARASQEQELEAFRAIYEEISRSLLTLTRSFGPPGEATLYEAHCPMAFQDRGANWLQDQKKVLNPYEGSRMLHCGMIEAKFEPGFASASKAGEGQGTSAEESERQGGSETAEEPASEPNADLAPLASVFESYLSMQDRLFRDDLGGARIELGMLEDALGEVDGSKLPEAAASSWAQAAKAIADAIPVAQDKDEIDAFRVPFEDMSMAMLAFVARHGHPLPTLLSKAHCPMAFDDEGADWLQKGDRVANPYEGARMPRCGSIKERYPVGSTGGR